MDVVRDRPVVLIPTNMDGVCWDLDSKSLGRTGLDLPFKTRTTIPFLWERLRIHPLSIPGVGPVVPRPDSNPSFR